VAELPLAPIDRIIRRAGAERVGDDAVKALCKILEDVALDIAREAVELARHAGRKTVTADDINLAVKHVLRWLSASIYK